MKKFGELIKDQEFLITLEIAKSNPEGREAKDLLSKVLPILQFAGQKSTFGAFEKQRSIKKIYQISRRYGSPYLFLTMSFDDINNPSAIRMALKSKNNTSFPAINDPEFLQKLIQNNNTNDFGTIAIPTTYSARTQLATDNPIEYVLEFKILLCDVLYILLGMKPDNISSYETSKKTQYFRQRQKGIFGKH